MLDLSNLSPSEAAKFRTLLEAHFRWIGEDFDGVTLDTLAQGVIDLHEALALRSREPRIVNSFDVMRVMGERDMKIHLAPLSNILRMQTAKAGVQVTIGVDGTMFPGLAENKFVGGLILADKEQFDAVKAELAGEKVPA